jgi:hypothetical protein
MQVGTYPTRNFAQLLLLATSRLGRRGAGHFCRPLHVAMQLGLYLHLYGAWRTVSEESKEWLTRCQKKFDSDQ